MTELTPEQIVQALNEQKWLDIANWQVGRRGGIYAPGYRNYLEVEARAIVRGLKAQDELAKSERIRKEVNESNGRLLELRNDLNAQVAALTEENRDALELISNARELRHTVACWDQMHAPSTKAHVECICAMGRLAGLYEKFGQLNREAPAPLVEQPPKTAKELDAAIDRFRAACDGAVPELERDDPEQPDLDAERLVDTMLDILNNPGITEAIYAKLTGAAGDAIRRLRAERASAGAAVGSWAWALEQLEIYRSVKRAAWQECHIQPIYVIDKRVTILRFVDLQTLDARSWPPCLEDFSATDWQLAEPAKAPTEGERASAGVARLCVVCGKSLASGCDCRRVNEIKM